jgi:hypothetical protein
MECRQPSNLCYRMGALDADGAPRPDGPFDASLIADGAILDAPLQTDAPLAIDARVLDAPLVLDARLDALLFQDARLDAPIVISDAPPVADARPIDAPIIADARLVDAVLPVDARPPDAAAQCTENDRVCAAGNLQICQGGVFIPAVPSCAAQGLMCFDPAPAGTDAYCGDCLKGSIRCTATDPSILQNCPSSGIWNNFDTCDSTLGCVDPDGPGGPQGYCAECVTGQKRCNGGLQTCVAGKWSTAQDCSLVQQGFSCFDPAPAGGTDAYCGACLKNAVRCNSDDREQCKTDGSAFVLLESCAWGCMVSGCCGEPDCSGIFCGASNPNACGRTQICGDCGGHPERCCSGTLCCNAFSCCVAAEACGACN